MEYGNYYTEETLRSLNAAYDTLYGITSRETEKVNGIIRRMEKAGRFPPVPQEGDLLEYFPQNGDYFPQAHIETIRKGQATVCTIAFLLMAGNMTRLLAIIFLLAMIV